MSCCRVDHLGSRLPSFKVCFEFEVPAAGTSPVGYGCGIGCAPSPAGLAAAGQAAAARRSGVNRNTPPSSEARPSTSRPFSFQNDLGLVGLGGLGGLGTPRAWRRAGRGGADTMQATRPVTARDPAPPRPADAAQADDHLVHTAHLYALLANPSRRECSVGEGLGRPGGKEGLVHLAPCWSKRGGVYCLPASRRSSSSSNSSSISSSSSRSRPTRAVFTRLALWVRPRHTASRRVQ